MNAAYDISPANFVVGVVFYGPTLRQPKAHEHLHQFKYAIKVNHTVHNSRDYIGSRFLTAQAYVERAAINVHRIANNKTRLSSPLPLKTTTNKDHTFVSYARFVGMDVSMSASVSAFYIIFTFQSVWLGVLSILVVEKKQKIRAGMSMMGLDSNAYLLSIWLMQNLQNLVTCGIMVIILFVGGIFATSSAMLVYILLYLFSLNATAFGTMASVLVPDPKKTSQASLLLLVVNIGAFAASEMLFRDKDPLKETLLFFLPSIALGRCISYIIRIEPTLEGVTMVNMAEGPCGRAIMMLMVDCVIYYFLAWYLDAVFSGTYGNAMPCDFFLRPSYWGFGKYRRHAEQAMPCTTDSLQNNVEKTMNEDQDSFEVSDLSRIPVQDRNVIQVTGLRKSFKCGTRWPYNIPLLGSMLRWILPAKTMQQVQHDEQEVVAGVDLQVHRNEIVGFLGHNGAGKTTCLSLMMGMMHPTAGSVVVDGHLLPGSQGIKWREADLRTLGEVQKRMGVCPQHDVLFESLTVWETMLLFAAIKGVRVRGKKSVDDAEKKNQSARRLLDDYLRHLLSDVYLYEKKHERVSTLSGGMKRKLSVALAFLGDPKVVLLDEPTTGMDVFTRKRVWQLMQESKVGRAILLTTHSMEEADALGDRIAILSKGRLQTLGSSMFLKNRFGPGYRLNLEKRRMMLVDEDGGGRAAFACGMENVGREIILFDEVKTMAIVRRHFPDAVVGANSSSEITYVLPTSSDTVAQRTDQTGHEYIRDKRTALPGLFEELDRAIASNRLGVKSVGLSLTTLEEVFIALQEQEKKKEKKEPLDGSTNMR
ncbi:ATP-binding cassette sub- A member 2 [Podila epigama]|nr:ATP-binding cassette sub- A member 2 [Podila epigama]